VAVKVIRAGLTSRSALRRFEYESELLARLRHNGIAQIYEAGTHRDRDMTVPYFAMEYIVGARPITDYVVQEGLSARERLGLFAQVCEAVHHGHQKGIIHRDLKPSNLLVDSSGAVKVIDFGVARSTDTDLAVTAFHTEAGQLIGTLQYMSPEQCAAGPNDIDTRSDVYALGVVLFEMLGGRPPYDITGTAIHEATRIVSEQPPTRLSALDRTLGGDVETIVLKTLEKDRDRRYQSASALVADIERYLNNEPISARPASAMYQFRKLVSRNKVPFAFLCVLFVLITTFGVWMSLLYTQAEQLRREAVAAKDAEQEQRELAEKTAGELRVVSDFQADMLAQIDPAQAGADLTRDVLAKFAEALAEADAPEPERAEDLAAFEGQWSRVNATDTARELIDRTILQPAIRTIDERFPDQPLVDASLRQTLADQYQRLGLYEAAMPLQTRALETRRRVLGDDDPATLESITQMATLLDSQSRFDEALRFFSEVLDRRRRLLGDDDPLTLGAINNLGLLLQRQGKLDEAEASYREALEGYRSFEDDDPETILTTLNNMGLLLQRQGRLDEAEPYYREALEGYRRVLGDEDPLTLVSFSNMGMLLREQGKLDEAEPYLRQALEGRLRVLGSEHPSTLMSVSNLAFFLEQAGRYAEAEPYCRDALSGKRRVLGDDHRDTLISISNMAKLLVEVGKAEEAERLAREAVDRGKATLGESHWFVGNFLGKYGLVLARLGRYGEAEDALLEGHDILAEKLGDDHEQTRRVLAYLVDLYEDWDAAEPGQGYDSRASEWRGKLAKVQVPGSDG
jgi:tetratricopeptide (TPR) repeat protein